MSYSYYKRINEITNDDLKHYSAWTEEGLPPFHKWWVYFYKEDNKDMLEVSGWNSPVIFMTPYLKKENYASENILHTMAIKAIRRNIFERKATYLSENEVLMRKNEVLMRKNEVLMCDKVEQMRNNKLELCNKVDDMRKNEVLIHDKMERLQDKKLELCNEVKHMRADKLALRDKLDNMKQDHKKR